MVELLARLLSDWKVSGSNFGPETGYPDLEFRGIPQYARKMLEN
jgi:hypothetical protein